MEGTDPMKLQTLSRKTGIAAAALALSVSLAACGSEDEPTTSTDETSEAPAPEPTEEEEPAEPAATEPFGPGCEAIPTSGEGSFDAMVQDPVGTAAGTNPVLTTLTDAVGAIEGLGDTLNSAPALTVFAPIDDPAFAAIPKEDLGALVEGGMQDGMNSALFKILAHHVVGERVEADAIGGEYDTLNGDTITVEGDPESGMTVTGGEVEANVLCGGIQTANATVYVIDAVMTDGDM